MRAHAEQGSGEGALIAFLDNSWQQKQVIIQVREEKRKEGKSGYKRKQDTEIRGFVTNDK